MRAFWLFSKNSWTQLGDDSGPSLGSAPGKYVVPGDITLLEGPVGNEHVHTLVGGIALPDDSLEGGVGEYHRHYVVQNQPGQWVQVTVGATAHTHTFQQGFSGEPIPQWFLVFWAGSDASASTLLAMPENEHIVEAVIAQNNGKWEVLSLDNTQWTAPEQTAWNNRLLNLMGITMPPGVDRGQRLVKLFLGVLISRSNIDERFYRFAFF